MDTTEQSTLLDEMQRSWPIRPLEPGEAELWFATLAPLAFDSTRQAVAELRTAQDWMPTHRELVTAAHHHARIASLATHSHAPSQEPCGLCDGGAWAKAGVYGGVDAVVRCRCTGSAPPSSHRTGCSCRTCYYGPERAADIAMGNDVLGRRTGPDPLAQPQGSMEWMGE